MSSWDSRYEDRVKLLVEGANGPTTPSADWDLHRAGVRVVPDVVANAGGVTCSYFEQVQGNTNYYWSRDEVICRGFGSFCWAGRCLGASSISSSMISWHRLMHSSQM